MKKSYFLIDSAIKGGGGGVEGLPLRKKLLFLLTFLKKGPTAIKLEMIEGRG